MDFRSTDVFVFGSDMQTHRFRNELRRLRRTILDQAACAEEDKESIARLPESLPEYFVEIARIWRSIRSFSSMEQYLNGRDVVTKKALDDCVNNVRASELPKFSKLVAAAHSLIPESELPDQETKIRFEVERLEAAALASMQKKFRSEVAARWQENKLPPVDQTVQGDFEAKLGTSLTREKYLQLAVLTHRVSRQRQVDRIHAAREAIANELQVHSSSKTSLSTIEGQVNELLTKEKAKLVKAQLQELAGPDPLKLVEHYLVICGRDGFLNKEQISAHVQQLRPVIARVFAFYKSGQLDRRTDDAELPEVLPAAFRECFRWLFDKMDELLRSMLPESTRQAAALRERVLSSSVHSIFTAKLFSALFSDSPQPHNVSEMIQTVGSLSFLASTS